MEHLLRVEDTFQVSGLGLVAVPELPLPERFANFTDSVRVVPPGAEPYETQAQFFLSHFSPGGFKLLVTFPSLAKELLPIGSEIFASESVHRQLRGADA